MKFLILGLGQDAILMSRHMQEHGYDYRFLCRRSSAVADKIDRCGLNTNSVLYSEVIDETTLLRTHAGFEFTHVFNFAANSFVRIRKLISKVFCSTTLYLMVFTALPGLVKDVWVFHPLSSKFWLISLMVLVMWISASKRVRICEGLGLLCMRYLSEQGNGLLHSCILFNHESSLRPSQFSLRKYVITFELRSGNGIENL